MSEHSASAERRNVILVGASAGGIQAVGALLAGLPQPIEAAIAITIHRSPTFRSELASVLGRLAGLTMTEAKDGELFEKGRIYVAPADHHVVFRSGAIWLDHGPKQHYSRPAVDTMFRSGASAYGSRVIGVLLTGNLSDGVAGLIEIKAHGGLSLVQEPAEAFAPSMPSNAIAYNDVDLAFNVASGSRILSELVRGTTVATLAGTRGARAVNGAGRRYPFH